MFDLNIFDVSALIYTGVTSSFYNTKNSYGYPVGGIHYLLKYLTVSLKNYDDVILVFDSKDNFRKKLDMQYKENRLPNKSVISQIEQTYEGLLSCGFNCYKIDGYEGDDIINWAVNQNLAKVIGMGHGIKILGNDRDLIHNVQNGVSFKPIRDGMNFVDITNFPNAIYKDITIRFNTISAYKVFCGCPSDNVKPFVAENGKTGKALYYMFTQIFEQGLLPGTYENTSSKVLLRNFIKQLSDLSDKDKEELYTRIAIIFPADCPEGVEIVSSNFDKINKEDFQHFMSLYNAFEALRCMEMRKLDLNSSDIEFLKNQAYSLNSGEFCVDKNIPVHTEMPAGSALFMKEF